tara:strand:+ start:931 stop:1215 length:285 start_codon:yes stop_codon:yes gene_type:complete
MKLEKPNLPTNIPSSSQWLSGIGAGSWFTISKDENKYRIKRFSSEGTLECDRLFVSKIKGFDIKGIFEFTYISHCKECTIIQNNKTYKFYTDDY